MLPVSQGCLVGRVSLRSLADACPAPCGLALSRGLLRNFTRAHDSLLSTPRKPKSARKEPPSPSQGLSALTGPLLSLPALSLGSSPGGQVLRPPSSPPHPPPTHQALAMAMPLARPTVFPESPDFSLVSPEAPVFPCPAGFPSTFFTPGGMSSTSFCFALRLPPLPGSPIALCWQQCRWRGDAHLPDLEPGFDRASP